LRRRAIKNQCFKIIK